MKKKQVKGNIVVYQAKSGAIQLKGDILKETMWASLDQIGGIFERDKSVISRHINNIFKDGELRRNSVVAFFATTAADGKVYRVEYFNLDLILSVGYRVNSKRATLFRQWATKILRDHVTKGYTLNPSVVQKNYAEFQKAVGAMKQLLPAGVTVDHTSVLELTSAFADTWLSLDAYDKGTLATSGVTKRSVVLAAGELTTALSEFRASLMQKGEATELFGQERQPDAVGGIVGNVMQSFGGKPLYSTVEEKAAHLLYFIIKNHPFADGNKRSGAFAFVWFLKRTGILSKSKMTPPALTALTLFVAESDARQKDRMVRLVLQLLR